MPKIKSNKADKQAAEDRELAALIIKNLAVCGMKKAELAEAIGLAPNTLYYRLRHPGTFRRMELQKIFDLLGFSAEDKAAIKW